MPKQLTTRGPVQVREFVPDLADAPSYDEREELVSRVRVHEKGADVILDVFYRQFRAGTLQIPREAEREMLERLFGEATRPPATIDREILGKQIDAHEEACMLGDTLKVTATRRVLWTYLTALLTDHDELERLRAGERGAA